MPLHILDIQPDGSARPAPDDAPEGPGAYRWFHFDRADPALESWIGAHLPDLAAAALIEAETRPRCDRLGDGLILNLRAVNLNPGEAADQMASIRMWVTPRLVVTLRLRRVYSLEALQDHVAAQNADRMARNSYALSMVAAVFLPLGFLTGLFGVNVGGMPGLDSPGAFAVLSLGLAAVGALSVAVLRWLRML